MKTQWSSEKTVLGLTYNCMRPEFRFLRESLRGGESLLDVGCGPGELYDCLRQFQKIDYTAADLTDEMLAAVRQKHSDVKTLELDVQDADRVPSDTYDWVVCSNVLIHIPQPYKALENLWRITRGALLLVLRGSDYPEDIVDINRAYQEWDGLKFFYNIFNHSGMLDRLRSLNPPPLAVDAFRELMHDPPEAGRIPIDRQKYRVWVTYYAVLKDPTRVKWLGEGDLEFDKERLPQRLMLHCRKLFRKPRRWEWF